MPALIITCLGWQCHGAKDLTKENTNTHLILDKGGCLANCKTYTIRIEQGGLANYTGKVNVSKTGSYSRKLTDAESSDLWEFIEKNDIFGFTGFTGSLGEDSQARTLV
ncbi:MAG: hypothetical protein JKX74_04380, partial [Flavobacteriales bacterium]|nr:hypothetical protein [Flavobacteriales bacterium]